MATKNKIIIYQEYRKNKAKEKYIKKRERPKKQLGHNSLNNKVKI